MSAIKQIREIMKKHKIDFYIAPSADAHQSEYVADYYRGRAYLSGFTGSAGTLLVGLNEAKLWTDGRYFIQAEEQLKDTGIDLMKIAVEGYETLNEWIAANIKEGNVLSLDGNCYSFNQYKELKKIAEKNKFKIEMNKDILNEVWLDRPSLPKDKMFIHEEKYAGKSVDEKLNAIREIMKKEKVSSYLVSSLDDIAWCFNIRGNDIAFNPVVISYAIITMDQAELYVDKNKVTPDVE